MQCSRRQCLGLSWGLQPWAEHSKASLCANKQEGLWRLRLLLANTALTVIATAIAAIGAPAKKNTTADAREVHTTTDANIQTSEQERERM